MALNEYDDAIHHIGLGAKGGTLYGFQLDGGFTQELQREGVGAPDFGGSTDLLGQVPSLARWTQDDFIGGGFQWTWGKDDAMFADSLGFICDPQGRSLVSCPPMFHKFMFDPDTKANFVSAEPRHMFMVAGTIYVVFGHGILSYQIDTGADQWLNHTNHIIDSDGTETIRYAQYDPNDQLIWAATEDVVDDPLPRLLRIRTDFSAGTPDVAGVPGPAGTNGLRVGGMTMRDSNILVNYGRKLYMGDPIAGMDDLTTPNITWTEVGRLPGQWKDSQPYNGMTYILCSDGSFQSQIVAFDGDGLSPICTFPASFAGKCMIEYAGRIFVGGTGTDVNGGEAYAELYEVSGASVRCVRSFSPETRTSLLNNGWPTTINDLVVHEGLLWFGQTGKRLMAYDVTSDGFFGGSEILGDAALDFQKLTSGRGRVWAYGVNGGDDTKCGIYRIAQPADAGSITSGDWNPVMVTSDFAYEPGMKKRWSELKVMHRYGAMAAIDYSTDSGESWSSVTISGSEADGQVYMTTGDLTDLDVSTHIRFRFTFDSTDGLTYHKELVAFTVGFAILDTGKYAWSFVINASEEIETREAELDESETQTQDVSAIATQLRSWASNKTRLTFTDPDGEDYDVQMVGYRYTKPIVGPAIEGTTYGEAMHSITLQGV